MAVQKDSKDNKVYVTSLLLFIEIQNYFEKQQGCYMYLILTILFTAIPTSSFNFIQLFFMLVIYALSPSYQSLPNDQLVSYIVKVALRSVLKTHPICICPLGFGTRPGVCSFLNKLPNLCKHCNHNILVQLRNNCTCSSQNQTWLCL